MNISKIVEKHTLNADNIGSVNANNIQSKTDSSIANVYKNTALISKTNVSADNAKIINNTLQTKISDIRNIGVQKNNSLTHIQKQPLYQKYHGLPGVGVIGTKGSQGNKGNSIYFGYINDFFDGVSIDVGNFIYAISERDGLGAASDKNYYDYISRINFNDSKIKNIIDNIQKDTTYLYTGTKATLNNTNYDTANQEKLMYNMLASLNNDSLLSISDLETKNTPNYKIPADVSKYNINDNATFDDKAINISGENIPWEDSDAIADILMNNAKTVTSINDVYPAQIIDSSNSSLYSDFYIADNNYNYIKEVQQNNSSLYITGPTQYYANISASNYDIKEKDGYYVSLEDIFYYIKKSFAIIHDDTNNDLFNGVLENSKTGLFGLSYNKLFKIVNGKLALKDKNVIMKDTYLHDFINKYYNIISDYITNLENDAQNIDNLKTTIKYSAENDLTLFVPTTLSNHYNAGDVLYFYTQNQDADDIKIEYMVCLTDEMKGCTTEMLINYAQKTTPFSISKLTANDSHILSEKAAILKNKAEDVSNKLFNKSCVNIINNYTDSALIVANADNDAKDLISLNVSCYSDSSLNLYSDKNDDLHIDSKNALILSNLYVNTEKLTTSFNAELKSFIYDNNIIFDDGEFVHPLDNIICYINPANNKLYAAGSVYCEQYFLNYKLDDNNNAVPDGYVYGYDLYDNDFKLIKSQYSTTTRLNINFPLDDAVNSSSSSYFYYVNIYVAKQGGLKFVSRLSKITPVFKKITAKNKTYRAPVFKRYSNNPSTYTVNVLSSLKIDILGQNSAFIPDTIGSKIIYQISDINYNESSALLNLFSNDASVEIKEVLFNNSSIIDSSLQVTNWCKISKSNNSSFNYSIDISANLPSEASTLSNYLKLDCDNSPTNGDCDLFVKLRNNTKKDSCNSRSIHITVAYSDGDDPYIKYQNFDITQPGFTDTRDCPKVSLNMHYGITDTQQYNTVENGVLCNQFITYMDINIENFKECWETFAANGFNVSMDLTLQNITSDIEWQSTNLISSEIVRRPTIKFIITNEDITEAASDTSSIFENYVKLNVVPFVSSEDLTSLQNNLISNIDENDISINTSTYLIENEKTTKSVEPYTNFDDEYILIDKDVVKNSKNTVYLYNGLQKDFSINIKNIKLDDFNNNTLKLKILYEIGNPIISNLYLRFAVTNVVIHCGDKKYTATIKEENKTSYLRSYNSTYDYSYRFISDKLDVMFNPLSYTVCPEDSETTYSNITGNIEKYGMADEILKSIRFYNSDVYNYSKLMNVTPKQSRENYYYNWSSLLLKKRYLQDNIKNIVVSPISFTDILGSDFTEPHIDPYNAFLYVKDEYTDTVSGNYLDTLSGDKYLGIVYNGSLMNPKYKNDSYSFIYNNETLELDRYSQLANNYPAWVSDSCAIELRSDALIKSMSVWNDEYNMASENGSYANILYKGVLSLYGNGYMHLSNNYDNGQYSDTGEYTDEQQELDSINARLEKLNNLTTQSETLNLLKESLNSRAAILETAISNKTSIITTSNSEKYKDVLSLKETKSLNDVYIFDSVAYDRIYGSAATKYEPEVYKYFRSFLYNINWIYPKYTNSEVTPYRLVSSYDYLVKLDSSINQTKYDKLVNGDDNIKKMVPYNLLYTVYPRVAYNDEKDTLNCIMLRRPTIGTDSDINSFDKCYKLNKRYFNLTKDEIKHLTVPYTVK